MSVEHTYTVEIRWTGDRGTGTSNYRVYGREHEVISEGRPTILGSADPAFRGDPTRWNPEQLLLASLSQCHLLWYLHLCAVHGVVVTSYVDRPVGTMTETAEGGHFTAAVLRPQVQVVAAKMVDKALALHGDAHRACFIANSVNFPVTHDPAVSVAA
ncbi:peroxiredoxin [Mycobacterium talmoniae]|uniref:Peroxiredoxin n=2 Tax=Mycobacterium talmoniae TaxID=1858794 RepID=A0A1S1NLN0_9MYCO|nr:MULTISPECIES: OsmC family protein [Mycobacterium]OHV05519.1 peroxiredoxin [Mycobacterium talmoniae]TDH57202.1 OsmC family peroxiredoxin [Mycobacterium eburneum]